MTEGHLLAEVDTELYADSVEWSPLNTDLLACGTYQLCESSAKRVGKLLVFKYAPDKQRYITYCRDIIEWCLVLCRLMGCRGTGY